MNDRRRFYGERTNRNRLLRDTENNMFFGVCAGAADYFGFDVQITRIFVALGGFFFFPTVLVIYLILGFLLEEAPHSPKTESAPPKDDRSRTAERKKTPEEPKVRRKRREDRELRRRVRSEPQATLRSVRHRSRELDRRLQRLEKYVTSQKFNLQREIDGLGE